MLGLLFGGAAYLYLDPAMPQPRRRRMLDQCAVRSVVTAGPDTAAEAVLGRRTWAVPELADGSGHDAQPAGEPQAGSQPWRPGIEPGNLCYVAYTSGSTGTPKGVAVEHGAAANMAMQLGEVFGVTPGTRVLQFASWSWDASACEILVTLAAGGTLVLAPEPLRTGGPELAAFLRRHRVQVATLTPSLLAALPEADLPDLRTVVAVGEPCPADLVDRWGRDGRHVLNGYGLTETTVAVSVGRCLPGRPVTIGQPLPGVTVRVVDDNDELVTAGQSGHLLVGGIALARGYLADPLPERPDEPVIEPGGQFFQDPDGRRWYRTGDIVVQDPDGSLSYVARVDAQLQVHGHRIEPAEIAAVLRCDPLVRACAITQVGGRLVAYVQADYPLHAEAQIAANLAGQLPAHMVPAVRVVEDWPLAGDGRPDLLALARATRATPSAGHADVEPLDCGVQAEVLALVRRVLDRPDVAVDDDFFEVGGHSLLAAELSVRLEQRFGVSVEVRQVIDHPTARLLTGLVLHPEHAGPAAVRR
jgi:amino acid adenylation domain-containing protein